MRDHESGVSPLFPPQLSTILRIQIIWNTSSSFPEAKRRQVREVATRAPKHEQFWMTWGPSVFNSHQLHCADGRKLCPRQDASFTWASKTWASGAVFLFSVLCLAINTNQKWWRAVIKKLLEGKGEKRIKGSVQARAQIPTLLLANSMVLRNLFL